MSASVPPEFDEETLPARIDIKKGEGISLNLTAYANPPNVTYQFYKEGVVFALPSRFRLSGGILNISNVRKEDKGSYMIKGTNNQGFATFNFSVNVKCKYCQSDMRLMCCILTKSNVTFISCV